MLGWHDTPRICPYHSPNPTSWNQTKPVGLYLSQAGRERKSAIHCNQRPALPRTVAPCGARADAEAATAHSRGEATTQLSRRAPICAGRGWIAT